MFFHSLIRSFFHSFIHSFIYSFIHLFIHSFIHLYSQSLTQMHTGQKTSFLPVSYFNFAVLRRQFLCEFESKRNFGLHNFEDRKLIEARFISVCLVTRVRLSQTQRHLAISMNRNLSTLGQTSKTKSWSQLRTSKNALKGNCRAPDQVEIGLRVIP